MSEGGRSARWIVFPVVTVVLPVALAMTRSKVAKVGEEMQVVAMKLMEGISI